MKAKKRTGRGGSAITGDHETTLRPQGMYNKSADAKERLPKQKKASRTSVTVTFPLGPRVA